MPRACLRFRNAFAPSLLATALVCLAACKPAKAPNPEPEETPASAQVEAVYPDAPERMPAEVKALCDALHGLPSRNKAECCKSAPGLVVTKECERNLAGAVQTGGLKLDAAKVKTCTTALAKTVAGCAWVGPHMPPVPPVCVEALLGQRADGDVCRSSLECKADRVCAGATPTAAGRCRAAAAAANVCNTGVDPLAPYLRIDVDDLRPACEAGFCDKNVCRPAVAEGGACLASVMCADGLRCAGGACVKGARGAEGDPCTGADCAEGLRCANRVCTTPRAEGQMCQHHAQCEGGCVQGRCKMVCSAAELLRALPRAPITPPKKIPGLKLKLPKGAPVPSGS